MLKINIPQHSRGLMIATARAASPLKANRFQSVGVEARILPAARHAYPETDAIGVAIAEKRKFLVPKYEQALDHALKQRD
jgi:hypothetical protein